MSKARQVYVINARGKNEPFSFQKVYRSARRVGAPEALAQDIAEIIGAEVYPGIKTFDIFKRIKKILASKSPAAAIKFSLKEGMRKLGPTGYPFENYIQKILACYNFKTEEAQIISGGCTDYEIDFLAYSQNIHEIADYKTNPKFRVKSKEKLADSDFGVDNKRRVASSRKGTRSPEKGRGPLGAFRPRDFSSSEMERNDFPLKSQNVFYIGECKYHRTPGARVDMEIALAHYARFLDIKEGSLLKDRQLENLEIRPLLTTNTKFSKKAVKYAACIGMSLLGWNYPPGKGLEYLIDRQKLYPITVLPSLKGNLVELFLNNKIVLIEDMLEVNPKKIAEDLDTPLEVVKRLVEEAKLLAD